MVTFFCGSDGDRGQLSSFVWLILSSLLPGYSTNKKTEEKRLVFFLPRKETVIMEKKTNPQIPNNIVNYLVQIQFLNC